MRDRLFPNIILGLTCCLFAAEQSHAAPQEAAPTEKKISYYRSVRPILQRQCSGCHFDGKREGGLSVVAVTELLKGGEGGASLMAGKPDESLLVKRVSGEKPDMPLNNEPLSAESILTLRTWIAQGAEDDTPTDVVQAITADRPPVYTAPPVVTSMDYSPDGKTLAVSGYHEVLLHTLDGSAPPRRSSNRALRQERWLSRPAPEPSRPSPGPRGGCRPLW